MNDCHPDVLPVWRDTEGEIIACTEKIKVMRENMEELASMAQDAFEDAVLMGCDPAQVREVFAGLMSRLETHF